MSNTNKQNTTNQNANQNANQTTTNLLDELSTTAKTVAANAGAAVVAIGQDARGTGIVIGANTVLTNAHNLRNPTVAVTFQGGRQAQGRVKAVDPDADLAVIEVDTVDPATGSSPSLLWAETAPTAGDVVFALSTSLQGHRVSFGMVSAVDRTFAGPRGREITGSIEHTAPLLRGASGGPLLDQAGRLVGINTHRLGEGFYLALPGDASTKAKIVRLAAGKSADDRRLGIALARPDVAAQLRRAVGLEAREGLLVRGVSADGVGAAAGIAEGDLLVAAGGNPLTVAADLETALAATLDEPRTNSITIDLVRGAAELQLTVNFPVE
jgi:serine protease Do